MAANPFPRPGQGGTRPLPAGAARDGAAAGRDPWPTWLDTDDFDGLGEEAWLASLADQEPDPVGPDDAESDSAWPDDGDWAEPEFGSAGPGEPPDMADGRPGTVGPGTLGGARGKLNMANASPGRVHGIPDSS